MRSEVAATLRRTLRDIVESGTARRVNKVFFNEQGQEIPVGGKTGTGDNRYETFGKGGQLLTSRVVNRTATFVFYIGDRFFGTVTAHVQGQDAANFDFTSALAAELLKAITPALEPLVENVKVPPTPVATETPIIPIAPVETAVPQATLVPTIGGPPAPALP